MPTAAATTTCPECGAPVKSGDKQCWTCYRLLDWEGAAVKVSPTSPFGERPVQQPRTYYRTNPWAIVGLVLAALAMVPAACIAFFVTCLVSLSANPQGDGSILVVSGGAAFIVPVGLARPPRLAPLDARLRRITGDPEPDEGEILSGRLCTEEGSSRATMPGMDPRLTIDDIREATTRLAGEVTRTPCLPSRTLATMAGCEVFLKFENLQFTASFKERGALNKMAQLSAEERANGVLAVSAGNHAQAVAYHAERMGIAATIVMPTRTPLIKVSAVKSHGAEVVLHGSNFDDAYAEAVRIQTDRKLTFVHPFNDPAIIAGQGTIGLEILEQLPDVDTIVAPIGGGHGGEQKADQRGEPDRLDEAPVPLRDRD